MPALRRLVNAHDVQSELTQAREWQLQGKQAQARTLCREILGRHPDQADAVRLLAELLLQAGLAGEAVSVLRGASAVGAHDPDLRCQLGDALMRLGRDKEAMNVLLAAQRGRVAHEPTIKLTATLLHRAGQHEDAQTLMGDALFRLGATAGVVDILNHWQALMPDDPVPQYRLAALRGEDWQARAADAYVRNLFDRYADTFDASLTGLGYQAPALIAQQLQDASLPVTGQWQVLDAGCGTGLCAPMARPFAKHLTGVDLSSAMVAKAAERGGFDELVISEITAYLTRNPARFDLIVSADTLIYFGELSTVLTRASHALRPSGWLAFTVEKLADYTVANGYRLNANGRYGHSQDYIRKTLAATGFVTRSVNEGVIRQDGDQPVAGWVVLAQRDTRDGAA